MPLLAIKCYLPGRKTQYVLSPTEDMSIDLGMGADLCPRGFDADTRVRFRLIANEWFVEPQCGQLYRDGGGIIESSSVVSLPTMLFAGSATLVLDGAVDPRLPARFIQDSAAVSAAPRNPPRNQPKRPHAAPIAPVCVIEVQPRAPMRQPEVAPDEPPPGFDWRFQQSDGQAAIELNETRILDMAQLGAPSPHVAGATDGAEQTGIRTVLARLRGNRRLVAYAVLGLLLVAFEFGIQLRARSTRAAMTRPLPAQVVAASSQAPASQGTRTTDLAESLPAGTEPNADRAAQLYALGEYRNALKHYRALAAAPAADPVFGVIAHALDQRLRRSQVRP